MFVVGQAVVDSPVWKKGGGGKFKKKKKLEDELDIFSIYTIEPSH